VLTLQPKGELMATVLIKSGHHGKRTHTDIEFQLVKGIRMGAAGPYLLVDGTGKPGFPQRPIRMRVRNDADYEIRGADASYFSTHSPGAKPLATIEPTPGAGEESDQQIKDRIDERFRILKEMVTGAADSKVRGMVVTGAPGVGKSHDVEMALARHDLINRMSFNPDASDQDVRRMTASGTYNPPYDFVKGHMSPPALYRKLYDKSGKGDVLVLDDCDGVLFDDQALQLLKAALDTTKRRVISWNTDNRNEDAPPTKFEFNGSIIFITNVNFERIIAEGRPAKLVPHLEAIMDRCFYLDMTIDTLREKLLRIDQVSRDMGMLTKQGLEPLEVDEVLEFVHANAHRFRMLSLRRVVQLGDLRRTRRNDWQRMAEVTLFKGRN
jgi:hypothetical protein